MRTKQPIIIQNPNGENCLIPAGTVCNPIKSKLLWDNTPQGRRAVYSLSKKYLRTLPKQFQFSAGGIWLSHYRVSKVSKDLLSNFVTMQNLPAISKTLILDGSNSLHRI